MYPNASTEPLSVIEANECNTHHGSLATARFQACFNEIEQMRKALTELKTLGERGMKPDYKEWLTFHDKVAAVASAALHKEKGPNAGP